MIQNVGGSKVTIDAGDNQVSLIGAGKRKRFDVHFNQNAYTVGNGSKVTIDAGDDKNIVNVRSGTNITDVIVAENVSYATIDAGAGNNFVSIGSNGRFVTVDGGKDSDVV